MNPSQPSETNEPTPVVTPPETPPKSSSKTWLIVIVAVLVLAAAGFAAWKYTHKTTTPKAPAAKAIRIGLSMDTLKELRWSHDRDAIVAEAAKKGADVTTLVADSDDATQVSQIENLIAQKVDVLIVIPHNAAALTKAIEDAHQAGIKVISYDRLLTDTDIDSYISSNSTTVGKLEAQYVMNAVPTSVKVANVALIDGSPTDNNATLVRNGSMSVLQPLISAGKVKLVLDKFMANWDPSLAYTTIKNYLAGGGKLDAAVVANDGMASGVVQALSEVGLAGKIPVSGQDADLPAVQRLVSGTQTVTMYKSVKVLGAEAADIAVQLAKGQAPDTNVDPINNGKLNVPTYLTEPVAVTKSNIMDTVVKDGWLSQTDIYGKASN